MTETIQEQIIVIEPDPEKRKRRRPKKPVDNASSEEQPTQPKKLGRPIVPWRHKEDGTVDNRALDPQYYMKYWREHFRNPYTCDICGKTLQCCGSGVHKHQRTMHCQIAKLKKQLS